jgi:hypothetical protein
VRTRARDEWVVRRRAPVRLDAHDLAVVVGKDLRIVAERILTPRRVAEVGWFNYEWIRNVVQHPPHPRMRWHYFMLWMMVGFEIWRQMFLAGPAVEGPRALEEYYG